MSFTAPILTKRKYGTKIGWTGMLSKSATKWRKAVKILFMPVNKLWLLLYLLGRNLQTLGSLACMWDLPGFRPDGARNVENTRKNIFYLRPGEAWLPFYLFSRN